MRRPIEPDPEQGRISREVEGLLSLADDACRALRINSSRCARLRQSILKWAFEGRLVDQDPTDEPASVLLERIKAEREGEGGKRGGGRKQMRRQRGRTGSAA